MEEVIYPRTGGSFVVGSGIVIPSISGGISLGFSGVLSYAVNIKPGGSGRIFLGTSGTFPVGSGSNDTQRVGWPIDPTFSGTYNLGFRVVCSTPSNLYASAEVSGQTIFIGVETASYT